MKTSHTMIHGTMKTAATMSPVGNFASRKLKDNDIDYNIAASDQQ